MGLGRRRFIDYGVSAAVLALAFGGTLGRPGRADARQEAVAGVLRDQPAARKVGRRYLAAYPQEADAQRLAESFLRDAPALRAAPAMHPTALRQHLAQCRQEDFTKGDTVLVDGWVLARSEARLCALATLVAA